MISIRPEWCEKIANGTKTIEVRKTRPKLETPFKCYIYMTKGFASYPISNNMRCHNNGGGVVIGEFVCDDVFPVKVFDNGAIQNYHFYGMGKTCLSCNEIADYIGYGKTGYGWHISELQIYDKPLELRQFVTEGDCDCLNCRECYWFDGGNGYNVEADCNLVYEYLGTGKTLKPLFRPPQSWCYVE